MEIAFTNGRVFVGDGRVLDKATVLVSEGKIKEIRTGEAALPPEVSQIPIGDNTLFPGFIDAHVHLNMDASPDPMGIIKTEPSAMTAFKSVEHARKTLAGGVTTVRDMGGREGIDLALKQAVASGVVPGPRILASGKLICMTGGHGWPMGREADGPDAVRRAAREQIKAGADQLKFMATGGVLTEAVEPGSEQLTQEEMAAGIHEAHKVGKKTATHAMGSQGIWNALRAGIDTIEHGIYLTEEILAFMAENQVNFIPTLAATFHISEQGIAGGIPEWAVKKNDVVTPIHRASVTTAYKAGIPIVMGTDAGTPFNFHGNNLMEISLLARYGLSPMDALLAATGRAARAIGMEESIGTIEPGKTADLVLVKGDPLAAIECFSRPGAVLRVMKEGQFYIG